MEEPYGPLITSTVGVVSWNVWGRFGPWEDRQDRIRDAVAEQRPDIVALQESWVVSGGESQAAWLADSLGLDHWFVGPSSLDHGGWGPVSAILSRWPILEAEHSVLAVPEAMKGWPGELVTCLIDGPRGQIPLVGVALDWPPHSSGLRQAAVRDLAVRCKAHGRDYEIPVVVCGDFNAGPDSAELRMLTGEDEPALPGFVLFDAWTKAGNGSGITWDRGNRWAMPTLLPSRRIDFILAGWPSSQGGAGDVTSAELVGNDSPELPPSDHYGISARIRY